MSCFPNALGPRLVGITQFTQVSRHRGSNTGRFVGGAAGDDRCEARCVVTVLKATDGQQPALPALLAFLLRCNYTIQLLTPILMFLKT